MFTHFLPHLQILQLLASPLQLAPFECVIHTVFRASIRSVAGSLITGAKQGGEGLIFQSGERRAEVVCEKPRTFINNYSTVI